MGREARQVGAGGVRGIETAGQRAGPAGHVEKEARARGAELARVVGGGPPAVAQGQAVLFLEGGGQEGAQLAGPIAGGQRHRGLGHVGVEGVVIGHAHLGAGVILFEHDVHDAGDGLGTVDGAGALGQDVDALDGGNRDAVHAEVLPAAGAAGRLLAGVGNAAAVDQHEGGIAAEPAHVERGANRLGARGAAVHEVVIETHRAAQLRNGQADVREPGHAPALEFDLRQGEDRDGRHFIAQGADARAGHFHRFQFHGLLFLGHGFDRNLLSGFCLGCGLLHAARGY